MHATTSYAQNYLEVSLALQKAGGSVIVFVPSIRYIVLVLAAGGLVTKKVDFKYSTNK
jgi:hypothetical protein